MAPRMRAQSSTERAMGPILSMLQASVMQPARLTRPKVGLSPVTAHSRQGEMMLPNVSLPSAKPTSPAAVALAEPADEPLEPREASQGLRVRSLNHRSPDASAPSDSLAASTAPASSSRAATVALTSSRWSLYASAPQVVG